MSFKVYSIFLFILMSPLIECNPFCANILTNGTYTGLGIYRFYEKDGITDSLRMYNRFGKEWRFDIEVEENFFIKLNESSVTNWSERDILHKFGFIYFDVKYNHIFRLNCEVILSVSFTQILI